MTGSRHSRACGRGDRGAAPVELAIALPLLMLLLFGSVQVSTYYLARQAALTAAEAAVRAERRHGAQPGEGLAHAESILAQTGQWLAPPPGGGPPVAGPTYTPDGTGVTYTVTGTALSIIPGLTWHIRHSAHATLEQETIP